MGEEMPEKPAGEMARTNEVGSPRVAPPEGVENRWPVVQTLRELPEAGSRIIACIEELEECYRKSASISPAGRLEAERVLGPVIARRYEEADFSLDDGVGQFREVCIKAALEEVRRVLIAPDCHFASSGVDAAGNHKVAHKGVEFALRSDQAASVRFWGICIEPEDVDRCRSLAGYILRRVLDRLDSDLGAVSRLCQGVEDGSIHPDSIRFCRKGLGQLFERLMVDVLNEDCRRASRANLWEDLLEWTDLRVKYPGLPRKNGARVQIKLIGQETVHEQEVGRWRHPQSYVVLSPVRLARYVEFCCEGGRTEKFDEGGFWACLNGQPADRVELSNALLRVIKAALRTPKAAHPLGPVASLPKPIGNLIRAYVRDEAFEAADRMRESLQSLPNVTPPWRKWR